jgi:Gas vesicle protein
VKRRRPPHSTVAKGRPPKTKRLPLPPSPRRPSPRHTTVVSHIVDRESSLLDVIDSLLNKGVVLNADIILALANVDLVYLRLSALLCAADRVLPPDEA